MIAMQYRQLPVEGVQVKLCAPMTASSPNPMLDIQTMTLVGQHGAQLRVACRTRGECLPFYVSVTWPEGADAVHVPAGLAHQGARTRAEVPSPPSGARLPSQELQAFGPSPDEDRTVNPKVRAGSPATLVIEDRKVHIRLRVVYLEGGATGDKVRVATLDRKQAFKAEIVTPGLLKGSF